MLDKSYGAPKITKDGVSVAKEVVLSDKFEIWAPSWSRKLHKNGGQGRRRYDNSDGSGRGYH